MLSEIHRRNGQQLSKSLNPVSLVAALCFVVVILYRVFKEAPPGASGREHVRTIRLSMCAESS